MRSLPILLLTGLLVLSAGRATALTTYAFEGVLGDYWQRATAETAPPWIVSVGATEIVGTFQYDEAASGSPGGRPEVWYFPQMWPANVIFEVGDVGWSNQLEIQWLVTATGPGVAFEWNASQEAAAGLVSDWSAVWLQLVGGPAGSILPEVIPTDLSGPWSVRRTVNVEGWECTAPDCGQRSLDWRLIFDLTSLTIVPEPGTATLVVLGLLGLATREDTVRNWRRLTEFLLKNLAA